LAKKLRTSNDKIQQFWNEFCCHLFHAQNIWKNVMTWANWYAHFIRNFSYCDSAIIQNHFFHIFIDYRPAGSTGALVIFNVFAAILEMLIPLVNTCFFFIADSP
jgi:hypothetical protein